MATYTPPDGDAVNFTFEGGYTAPAGDDVNFLFGLSGNKINIGNAWKDLSEIQISISNSWKDVSEGYINVGDSWKQFYGEAPGPSTFRFEVKTTGADTFQLPIYDGGVYDFHVVWGDGGEDDITAWNDAAANHSYAGAGTWNVEITGTITGWRFVGAGDKDLIYDISEWGPLNLGNLAWNFYSCPNLTISATDILDLTGTTTFYLLFRSCGSLTTVPSMNSWDVSAVTNMAYMFMDAALFNQDIGSWNTSAVTTMQSAFEGASAFNQDIGSWNTAAVIAITNMFKDATSFNQNIGSWNVSGVPDLQYMFAGATSFNQDIGSWSPSTATAMINMFSGATSFDQDIGGWDITSALNLSNMFLNITLSTANYDALLIGWEAQAEQPNVTFHGGNSTYSAGAAATARAALVTNGWTITDGGPA